LSPLSIAIDGPSGVGKTTAARQLAKRLGIPYLDTGAMYRAVGLEALRKGADPGDPEAVGSLLQNISVELTLNRDGHTEIRLDGHVLGDEIRALEVGEAASQVAVVSAVRRFLVRLQRDFAHSHGGVLEGRDIGTVVLPQASFKFFLDARPTVRAQRRLPDIRRSDPDATVESVARDLTRRDDRDRSRQNSPLRRDESYVYLDTSDLDVQEVVEKMALVVRSRSA
jgi:cytidylate kinase